MTRIIAQLGAEATGGILVRSRESKMEIPAELSRSRQSAVQSAQRRSENRTINRRYARTNMPTSSVSNVTKPIGKLLDMMDHGKLVLPEIQRDFVWSRKAIKLVIDSFYRG